MKPQHFTLWAMLASAALATATTLIVQQVRAAGIPAKNPLTYTGYLENPDATPVVTSKNIALAVYDAVTAGTKVCEVLSAPMVPVLGRFQIALPDDCTAKVGASPDLWLEIAVDGAALGRTKLGAVPYAVEAGHAVKADLATNATNAASAASATNAANAANASLFAGEAPTAFQRPLKNNCAGGIVGVALDGTTTCGALEIFYKGGDNGTASCSTFCLGSQWGATGFCIAARKMDTLEYVTCDVGNGVKGLDCWCGRAG